MRQLLEWVSGLWRPGTPASDDAAALRCATETLQRQQQELARLNEAVARLEGELFRAELSLAYARADERRRVCYAVADALDGATKEMMLRHGARPAVRQVVGEVSAITADLRAGLRAGRAPGDES